MHPKGVQLGFMYPEQQALLESKDVRSFYKQIINSYTEPAYLDENFSKNIYLYQSGL